MSRQDAHIRKLVSQGLPLANTDRPVCARCRRRIDALEEWRSAQGTDPTWYYHVRLTGDPERPYVLSCPTWRERLATWWTWRRAAWGLR